MNAYWTAAFNLLSALIGGVIAGYATIRAQNKSIKDQRKRDQKAEADLINGFVQAIEYELKSVWDRYSQEIGPHLKALPDDEVAIVFPLHQSYFVVFDSNASLVGRIPDKVLRERIIGTYIEAKGFVDSIHYYERLLINGNRNPPAVILSQDEAQRHLDIVAYSQKLAKAYSILEKQVKELLDVLYVYLSYKELPPGFIRRDDEGKLLKRMCVN